MIRTGVILTAILAAFLSMNGCGKMDNKTSAPLSASNGPWVVVPAASGPYAGVNRNNTTLFSAWRLNSQTGALEFCTYDPGGVVLGTTPTKETLLCTAPVKPLEIDN
jgi:hypothetical protein